MNSMHQTSTGHRSSDAWWLDTHFESARPEYEESLRYVRVQPGWTVLDAGCGSGGFVPLLCEQVGPGGSVVALDLAPENIAVVDSRAREGGYIANLQTKVGSILALPFADATFDCVWSANVMEYLTETQSEQAIAECKRVLKPGGTLALKDYDASHLQIVPMDPEAFASLISTRRKTYAEAGVLGVFCGTSLASRLRKAGLLDIRRRGWLVERWAPLGTPSLHFIKGVLTYWSDLAATYGLPAHDVRVWQDHAANPESLIDDPDFCYREFFVVAVGRTAA